QELEERYKKEKEAIEVLEEEPKNEKPKISIDDFLSASPKEKTVPLKEAYSEKKSTYHTSPIISPIYGIEEEQVKKNTTLELENKKSMMKKLEKIMNFYLS